MVKNKLLKSYNLIIASFFCLIICFVSGYVMYKTKESFNTCITNHIEITKQIHSINENNNFIDNIRSEFNLSSIVLNNKINFNNKVPNFLSTILFKMTVVVSFILVLLLLEIRYGVSRQLLILEFIQKKDGKKEVNKWTVN